MSQKHKELPNILYFFEKVICKIPHGSENCGELSDWIVKFAKERSLKVSQDEKKNVIVIAPATQGYEKAKSVILQAHLDMVAVSKNDQFDMNTHTIETIVEGDWMKANETSLGADDGMGVAMMLYILDNDSIKHPELVCIFTVDEEIGGLGAEALDLSKIPFCPYAINLDWEDDKICIGSAGAKKVIASKTLQFNDEEDVNTITISVTGLKGGHSALDIDKGGANAIKVVVDALYSVANLPYRLVSINGGPKMNSIPTECTAVICCADPENAGELHQSLVAFLDSVEEQYSETDPEMQCGCVWGEDQSTRCISVDETTKVVEYLYALPTGVIAMNSKLENTLETSLNLGVVSTTENEMTIEFLIRSSQDSEAERIFDELKETSSQYEANTSVVFTLPAWEPNFDYPLLNTCIEAHKKVTGEMPSFEVTHGGLECSTLMQEGSQWIALGPTILYPHTINERVDLRSIEKKFAVLCYMLENLA